MKKNLCAALIALATATGIGLVAAEPGQAAAPSQITTVSHNGTLDQNGTVGPTTTVNDRNQDALAPRRASHRTPMPPTRVSKYLVHGSW